MKLTRMQERIKKELVEKYEIRFETIMGIPLSEGSMEQKYDVLVATLREMIASNWIDTNQRYTQRQVKQVYYFSIEFLPGRLLDSYLVNLGIREVAKAILDELGIELSVLERQEKDLALGSGGLGRLAACFMDSMASCGIPGHGCGISYRYGLFRQKIVDGNQVELPDRWRSSYNVWQFPKRSKSVEVRFGGKVHMEPDPEKKYLKAVHTDYEAILAVPHDMPIIGYRNSVVNTLRLWRAEVMPESNDFNVGNPQDYLRSAEYRLSIEALSEMLYPDDSQYQGKVFRLKQQYFMVSAGIQSILRYYDKHYEASLEEFDDYIAIHINDTHPTLVIPELMRLLIDERGMEWEQAWRIVQNSVSYTNHTILPEAMEKWPVEMVSTVLPRIYKIIEEIDRRIRIQLEAAYSGDEERINNMSIIHDGQVFMVNLAIHGSYSVNGVAHIHTEILKKDVLKDFYQYYSYKFNNKTNGITHRRWLLNANPKLAKLITGKITDKWIKHPKDVNQLIPFLEDADFLKALKKIKQDNKKKLAQYIWETNQVEVDPHSIFDVHIKRIHAYKRQLLNIFHVMYLYQLVKENPSIEIPKRTFIFAGKAAPSYFLAKAIIKLINAVADKVNNDKDVSDKMKVVFLANYSVSLAEMIIPAADVSEQISTASKEASGTGNMKMMMNGAITLGTLDGANIEIHAEVGDENFVKFGLTADEVLELNKNHTYYVKELIDSDPRLQKIMNLLVSGDLDITLQEATLISDYIYQGNDEFYVLKDFDAYVQAQEKVAELYKDQEKWIRMAGVNIAKSGKFSSDLTIHEYAVGIWQVESLENEED